MQLQQAITLLNSATTSNAFANISYTTTVKTAAAHKALNIQKHVTATVQIFNTASAYTTAVKNSAAKIASNNSTNVQNFKKQQASFTHLSNCYAIVHNANTNNYMLYARFINVQSTSYTINNKAATKQQVAQYLTASAQKQLLNNSSTTHNKANNIQHNVVMRTISLSNINSITYNKQTITANS